MDHCKTQGLMPHRAYGAEAGLHETSGMYEEALCLHCRDRPGGCDLVLDMN
jgi:hypothetical protein